MEKFPLTEEESSALDANKQSPEHIYAELLSDEVKEDHTDEYKQPSTPSKHGDNVQDEIPPPSREKKISTPKKMGKAVKRSLQKIFHLPKCGGKKRESQVYITKTYSYSMLTH